MDAEMDLATKPGPTPPLDLPPRIRKRRRLPAAEEAPPCELSLEEVMAASSKVTERETPPPPPRWWWWWVVFTCRRQERSGDFCLSFEERKRWCKVQGEGGGGKEELKNRVLSIPLSGNFLQIVFHFEGFLPRQLIPFLRSSERGHQKWKKKGKGSKFL